MEILLTIVAGVIVFFLGQMLQQFILEPIKEFRKQRADAIYYVVRFRDLTDSSLVWDADEKNYVKQMRAALIYSIELIPYYSLLSSLKIFGLPDRSKVHRAAEKIGMLANIVNTKSGAVIPRDLILAEEIGELLGAKAALTSQSQ
jgi:hypothetical protein